MFLIAEPTCSFSAKVRVYITRALRYSPARSVRLTGVDGETPSCVLDKIRARKPDLRGLFGPLGVKHDAEPVRVGEFRFKSNVLDTSLAPCGRPFSKAGQADER
jgi:hypothetical protein